MLANDNRSENFCVNIDFCPLALKAEMTQILRFQGMVWGLKLVYNNNNNICISANQEYFVQKSMKRF